MNNKDPYCETPLDRAAEYGSIDAVKFLLDHGAEINQSNVLHFAAGSARCERDDPMVTSLMEYLLSEAGIDVNSISTTDERDVALHRAVKVASRTRVSFLLNHGADLAVEDEAGLTPLEYASQGAKDGGSEECKDIAGFLEEWVEKQRKGEE